MWDLAVRRRGFFFPATWIRALGRLRYRLLLSAALLFSPGSQACQIGSLCSITRNKFDELKTASFLLSQDFWRHPFRGRSRMGLLLARLSAKFATGIRDVSSWNCVWVKAVYYIWILCWGLYCVSHNLDDSFWMILLLRGGRQAKKEWIVLILSEIWRSLHACFKLFWTRLRLGKKLFISATILTDVEQPPSTCLIIIDDLLYQLNPLKSHPILMTILGHIKRKS